MAHLHLYLGPSWPWSYGSWIYNYLCNQCLSPLMLWVRILIRARCTTLCDKVCQWLETGRWFSPGIPVSSNIKTDRHVITEILLKVALKTIKQTNNILLINRNTTLKLQYIWWLIYIYIWCNNDQNHQALCPLLILIKTFLADSQTKNLFCPSKASKPQALSPI